MKFSWWFFHIKRKKIPRKNNSVIVEKISRFIRGLTAEDTNSQMSQNRARLCAFKIALNPSE